MSLSGMVAELEDDCERYRQECVSLEENLDDVEQDLEVVTQQRDQLQEFKNWVQEAYPVIIKDYESVKLIEEVANEHS